MGPPPNPSPQITFISPSSVVGSDFTLTINGTGFDAGAVDQVYLPDGTTFVGQGTSPSVSADGKQFVVTEHMAGAAPLLSPYIVKVSNSDGQFSSGAALSLYDAVAVSPTSGPLGTSFAYTGQGFTGGRGITSHLKPVRAAEFNTRPLTAAMDGTFSTTIDTTSSLPTAGTTYEVWAVDDTTQTETLPHVFFMVTAVTLAPTCTLTATPTSINAGESSTLSWTTTNNPTSATIDNGIGSVNLSGGSLNVSPASTTTYTLTVSNTGGPNQCFATVHVNPPTTISRIIQLSTPVSGSPFANSFFRTPINRDGSRVAFITTTDPFGNNFRLFSARPDGTEPLPISPLGLPVSRNYQIGVGGNRVVFVGCPILDCSSGFDALVGEVYVVNADGTDLRQVSLGSGLAGGVESPGPVISGDGTTVVYRDRGLAAGYLRVAKITSGSIDTQTPFIPLVSWQLSADGSRLAGGPLRSAFGDPVPNKIYLINTDGTGLTPIVDNAPAGGFALSGAGTTIAFPGAQGDGLYITDVNGRPPVTLEPAGTGVGFPSLTFDGSQVAYLKTVSSSSLGNVYDVFTIGADGTNRQNVTNTPAGTGLGFPLTSWAPTISENGSAIAFFSTADFDTGKNPGFTWQVFAAVLSPSLSVDGAPASSGPQGQTFSFTGFGFTLDQTVTRRVRQSDSVEVTLTPPISADPTGRITWTFTSTCTTPLGTYTIQVTDDRTGRVSNSVTETVMANSSCVPASNQPPTAGFTMTAGAQSAVDGQTLIANVPPGTTENVSFDSSRSRDPEDGAVSAFEWTIDGQPVSNSGAFASSLAGGVHVVSLVVKDSAGASSTAAQATVAVQDFLPRVNQLTSTTSGMAPFLVFNGGAGPTTSADGSLVAFVLTNQARRDEQLYVAQADGGGLLPVSGSALAVRAWGLPPTFGNKIAFVACPNGSDCQGGPAGFPGDVYVVVTDGTGLKRLTVDGSLLQFVGPWYFAPVVSHDGTTVAFTMINCCPPQNDRLFIINADGTARRELILPVSTSQYSLAPLSFSPDGSQLALAIGSADKIYAINTDGTGFRTLSDHAGLLSGDWTTVAYFGTNGLSLAKTDGTAPILLDSAAYPDPVSISYDGSQIAYSRLVGSFPSQRLDVFLVNSDGTNARSIANTPEAVDANGNLLFSFRANISQNGSAVAFVSNADLDAGKNTDLSQEVFVAQLRPSLSIDGAPVSSQMQGGTFTFTGFGFTANQLVTRRVRQPNGVEVTLGPPMNADATGHLPPWTFPSTCGTAAGDYLIWVIDDTTGRISNTVTETIITNPICP